MKTETINLSAVPAWWELAPYSLVAVPAVPHSIYQVRVQHRNHAHDMQGVLCSIVAGKHRTFDEAKALADRIVADPQAFYEIIRLEGVGDFRDVPVPLGASLKAIEDAAPPLDALFGDTYTAFRMVLDRLVENRKPRDPLRRCFESATLSDQLETGHPNLTAMDICLYAFYSIPTDEQRQIFNGWDYMDAMDNFARYGLLRDYTPMVMRSTLEIESNGPEASSRLSANFISEFNESTSPVAVSFLLGTTRNEAIEGLDRIRRIVEARWEQLIVAPDEAVAGYADHTPTANSRHDTSRPQTSGFTDAQIDTFYDETKSRLKGLGIGSSEDESGNVLLPDGSVRKIFCVFGESGPAGMYLGPKVLSETPSAEVAVIGNDPPARTSGRRTTQTAARQ